MSLPFFGREFTFTQPDGTKLKVKGWGNQDKAVFALPGAGLAIWHIDELGDSSSGLDISNISNNGSSMTFKA